MFGERLQFIRDNFKEVNISFHRPQAAQVAQYIDHTLLASDASEAAIRQLCADALKHGFASVCVNGCYAGLCSQMLAGSPVKTCCVVGFPLGAMTTSAKVFETRDCIENGAREIDMVINQSWMKDQKYDLVYDEIRQIAAVCRQHNVVLKVIIEATCLEQDSLITDACILSQAAGADFVKTSTGMHAKGGARAEHVKLMREAVGDKMGVKAAGGIKTVGDCMKMVEAGANRIGTSRGVEMVDGQAEARTY